MFLVEEKDEGIYDLAHVNARFTPVCYSDNTFMNQVPCNMSQYFPVLEKWTRAASQKMLVKMWSKNSDVTVGGVFTRNVDGGFICGYLQWLWRVEHF